MITSKKCAESFIYWLGNLVLSVLARSKGVMNNDKGRRQIQCQTVTKWLHIINPSCLLGQCLWTNQGQGLIVRDTVQTQGSQQSVLNSLQSTI